VRGRDIYHLVPDHESCLEREPATAELEQVLKRGPQQVHDHDVDTLVAGALLAGPLHDWETLQVVPVLL
jgi:hypothetical protein